VGANNQTITVIPLPVLTITPTSANVSSGLPATLTVSGATTYSWAPPTALSATSGASVVASPTTTITYTVTGTSAGCTATATSALTVLQAPTITSVSPNVANPGTTINITGTNFSTTAANNKVFFGATKAVVSAASATSLTVTSPVGGTYAPLSVLDSVTGLTGYEQYAYLPKFNNSAYLSGVVNFNPKADLTSGANPYTVAIGDLDGDGKADLAVVNSGAGSVSVFRNISSSGSISTASFAAKVDFTTGTTPYGVAIGDK
jgi:hypothetical protein